MNKRKTDTGKRTWLDILAIALGNPKVVALLVIWAGGSTALHTAPVKNLIYAEPVATPEPIPEITGGGFEGQVRAALESLTAHIEKQAAEAARRQAQIDQLKKWHE